jgi:hypothetical protein
VNVGRYPDDEPARVWLLWFNAALCAERQILVHAFLKLSAQLAGGGPVEIDHVTAIDHTAVKAVLVIVKFNGGEIATML